MDDAALFTARFADGSFASFEATRFALGRKNGLRLEINGTEGSIAFDFEENNVLQFFDGTQPVEEQGFRRILVTEPEHRYVSAWWPPGEVLWNSYRTNAAAERAAQTAADAAVKTTSIQLSGETDRSRAEFL